MKKIHFKKIYSTHLYAKKNITFFDKNTITVITTDFQTNGIGTHDRKWLAPQSSSILSSIIYNCPRPQTVPYLSQLCAFALKDTLLPLQLPITFKYPNDLLIKGKKLSGILSEQIGQMMITSIGVNISQSIDDLSFVNQRATSLLIETNKYFSRDQILLSCIENFFKKIKTNHLS